MTAKVRDWLCVAICAILLAACSPILVTPPSPVATSVLVPATEGDTMDSHRDVVAVAQADLAARLGVEADQIVVREINEVTWPDASLGCPQPDMVYAQMEQAGVLIRLGVGGATYHYHSGATQAPFLCEASSLIAPPPQDDELVPPPNSEIN